MSTISRRTFLKRLGAVGALSALHTLDILATSSVLAEAASSEDYRALVCVFLYGGNDGNNIIVPAYGNDYSAYSNIRGTLAIPAQDFVPLMPISGNPTYGIHPQLAPLQDVWNNGAMTFLFNVGTLVAPTTKAAYTTNKALMPDNLFSHLDQQILWQGTGPSSLLRSGWGGRIADRLNNMNGTAATPTSISIAGDNLYLTGNITSALAIPATGGFSLTGFSASATDTARRAAMDQLLAIDRESLLVKGAGDIIKRGLESSKIINPVLTANSSTIQNFFSGQDSNIAKQLLQVAKLIEARTSLGVKRQIFFVSMSGFDTHVNQVDAQSKLFAQLAPALKAFYDATVQLGVASNVTTFTQSDFGRTLQPNTNGGTDHGWGSHHLVMGGAVRGRQFYGQYPTLALDGPDDAGKEGRWIPTISVDQYAATLATWFGVSTSDLSSVVPNIGRFASANLGFLG